MENMYDNNMLPPGYRFYPTEEELVEFYLRNKLDGKRDHDIQRVIPVINIYHHNPSELPAMAGEVIKNDSEQWFFFIPIQDREARGGRPTRLTTQGYWKATGTPGFVYSSNNNRIIGGKRTMVFYKGRAPNGKKTQWKMNEYKASTQREPSINNNHPTNLKLQHEFSLCRVYKKSKCVRAFDRRPAGSGLFLPPNQPLINIDHDQTAPLNNNNNNNNDDNNNNNNIGTSSLESSSLGLQPMGNFNDLSETPLWDFDWNFM